MNAKILAQDTGLMAENAMLRRQVHHLFLQRNELLTACAQACVHINRDERQAAELLENIIVKVNSWVE